MAAELPTAEVSAVFAGVDMAAAQTILLRTGRAVVYTHCRELENETNETNEDAAAVFSHGAVEVLVVADGAGGMPAGDRAAKVAVESVVAAMAEALAAGLPLREGVLRGFERANQAVIDLGVGAATTLAVVEIEGGHLRAYHAGDSRVLVCGQRGREKLLTASHSPVGYAVQAGLLDEKQALADENLHLVDNMLGHPAMRVEVGSRLALAPKDTVVLGSDGLFDNLAPAEIIEVVRVGPLPVAVGRAVQKARDRMHSPSGDDPSKPDDLTVVAYRRS